MFGLLGNLIWFFFGGFFLGLGWFFVGLLAFISVWGIPWSKACFVIAQFSMWPFGKEAVNRKELTGEGDIGTEYGLLANIIWFIFCGWWLSLGHLFSALLCFITIIGIPFGVQHLKLAGISLFPIGVTIVSKKTARNIGNK